MSLIKYPYTNLHELNLDWLIEQLNNQDGPVRSVNGKTGIVTLTGEDIERSTSNPQTVADALQSQGSSLQSIQNKLGTTALPTTAQTVTGAIAEHESDITGINSKIGSTALPTIAQTLTGAIAENAGEIADQEDLIGSTPLPTTAQTITGAIAEHESDISALSNVNIIGAGTAIASTTVASGSFTQLATFTPTENGAYMIEADAGFEAGTGIRILLVDIADTNSNTPANSVLSEGRATLQKVRYFTLSTTDTVYIKAYQTSGANMSVNGYFRVMRLR